MSFRRLMNFMKPHPHMTLNGFFLYLGALIEYDTDFLRDVVALLGLVPWRRALDDIRNNRPSLPAVAPFRYLGHYLAQKKFCVCLRTPTPTPQIFVATTVSLVGNVLLLCPLHCFTAFHWSKWILVHPYQNLSQPVFTIYLKAHSIVRFTLVHSILLPSTNSITRIFVYLLISM